MPDDFEIEDAEVIKATDRALLIRADAFDEPTWVPKSQITDDSEVYGFGEDERGPGTLVVTGWIADKNGWR